MNKNKARYIATVQNDQGAGEHAGSDTNLARLKSHIRSRYGRGWIVTISKIEHDGGIMNFAPVEIEKFVLRK